MPVDPASLVALGALAAPVDGDGIPAGDAETVALVIESPAPPSAAVAAGRTDDRVAAAAPEAALAALTAAVTRGATRVRDAAAGLLPDSDVSRRRTAVLAGGSVAAGLLAGLLVPASAEAGAAPTRTALVVAAASPFAGVERPTVVAASTSTHAAAASTPAHSATASSSAHSAAARPATSTAVRPVVAAPVADPLPPHRLGPPSAVAPVVAAYVPTRPLPARSGSGRRIVYAERAAHLWVVGADGQVLRDYKVTGRVDRPKPGVYHVYSKSPRAVNPGERLTFDLMVRFAYGVTGARIGFHTIPRYYDGRPIQAEKDLGRAIGMGGCVRQSRADAAWLYAWSRVGDTVVVLH